MSARWLTIAAASVLIPLRAAIGAPIEVVPGKVTEFEAILSAKQQEMAAEGGGGRYEVALGAVAVPRDFDPARTWPVLVISATSDPGYNSSRTNLRWFAAAALRAGWVLVAADPTHPVEVAKDSNGLRYGLILAAIDRLEEQWPAMRRWPRAFGGISGGAKRSAWLAALSCFDGYRPLGVLQSGCNQPVMIDALQNYHPARAEFLSIPVFLSSGMEDTIATPDDIRGVKFSLGHEGFRHVRLEQFSGGHEVWPAHVETALRWFVEVAASKN